MESAAVRYENLSDSMQAIGYSKIKYEACVFNKSGRSGVQCTAAVHVDELIITCVDKSMISELCDHLTMRYGAIPRTDGTTLNYLGMVFDLSTSGEVKLTVQGYVEDTLTCAAVAGNARSPATDGPFEVRDNAVLVPEEQRVVPPHSSKTKLSS